MDKTALRVFKALSNVQFSLTHEITLHQEMEKVFENSKISFKREVFLSKKDKVDFLIEQNIALEVKIKGRPMSIYKQCERYCQHENVKLLILASSKPMRLPPTINGKPAYFFNLTGNALM